MVDNIINIPINEYLNGIGIETRKEGNRYFASSPFSRDSNWSFCIYNTNTYFDFANGHGGNIINLVARLDGCSLQEAAKKLKDGIKYEKYKPNYKEAKEKLFKQAEFKLERYINKNEEECSAIKAYAESRGITEGYFCGLFYTRQRGNVLHGGNAAEMEKWIRVPALAFLHVDKDLKPCGIKFRKIVQGTLKDQSPRFSARGLLGFYILEQAVVNLNFNNVLYVVESESSANSLWMYLKKNNQNSVVISRGGVSSAFSWKELPEKYQTFTRKLIIDYDGNEELYKQRLSLYKDLGADPIKLILPKGEDINSLFCKNEMWKIEQMLL